MTLGITKTTKLEELNYLNDIGNHSYVYFIVLSKQEIHGDDGNDNVGLLSLMKPTIMTTLAR